MVQRDEPDDFVLATNECHSVREFVEKAFECVDMKIKWTGEKGTVDEIGVDATDETRELVKIDPQYFRPTEVDLLIGDPAKAKKLLGWEPEITFEGLVQEMMEEDMKLVEAGDLIN